MKFRALLAFAALGTLLAIVRAANAGDSNGTGLVFTGVLVADGHTKVALTDRTAGTTTWIEPGKDYHGYVLARYDAKSDTVVLKKDGQEYPLSLTATKNAPTVTTTPPAALSAIPTADTALTPTGNPTVASSAALNPSAPVAANPPPPVVVNNSQPSVNVSVLPTPVATDLNYVTREGDTLTKISAATGLSLERLQELNPGVNASALLKAGDPIRTR